jgi:hypothetical protein
LLTVCEDGIIYLVPEETDMDLAVIREVSIDSVLAKANTPVSISLSGLENGTYWLYARDSTGNLSDPEAFTITGVGIENSDADDIKIYPNPANTFLTINTRVSGLHNIEITSLNGKQIFTEEMEGTSFQIDLSSFMKGVYFITIRSKQFVTTRKIIKL